MILVGKKSLFFIYCLFFIVCPQGLKSKAIPEYVYFGAMVASFSTNDKNDCLQSCITNTKCKAVNFFEPIKRKDKGFCELLSEDQYDNPRLLRSFKKATYYENVACRYTTDNNLSGISKAKGRPKGIYKESKM